MSASAPRIYTDQTDIDALEARVLELHDEARVDLVMADGSTVRGNVSVRPTVQVFRDGNGNEGINALLRLDDADDPELTHYLWLDEIVEVHRIGTA